MLQRFPRSKLLVEIEPDGAGAMIGVEFGAGVDAAHHPDSFSAFLCARRVALDDLGMLFLQVGPEDWIVAVDAGLLRWRHVAPVFLFLGDRLRSLGLIAERCNAEPLFACRVRHAAENGQ